MRPLRSAFVCALLGLSAAACTGAVDGAAGSDVAATSGSVGILRVQRTFDADPEVGARHAALGAAFARYHGIAGTDVAQLLGGGAALDTDACTTSVAGGDGLGAPEAEVELLDVGVIDVRLGAAGATLEPRTFPELGSVATGVFYAGDGAIVGPTHDGDIDYVFRAAGSADVAGFEVAITPPGDLAEVRLDGALADLGPTVWRGRGLELTWAAGDVRDRVEIELRAGGDAVVCAARDDGAFRIDALVAQALGVAPDARVVVRRVRVQGFDAQGVDSAWARVSTERAFGVALE